MSEQQFLANLICANYIKTGIVENDYSQLPRPFYSIAYVERGRLECIEGDRTVVAEPGDMVFLPYHLRYILRWIGEPEVSVYSCHFLLPPSVDLFAAKVIPMQKLSGEGLLEELLFIHNHIHDREQILGVFSKFYSLCHRVYVQMDSYARAPMDERIRVAVDYIHANYHRALAVETLAAVAHMSPSRFYYCFKKETGLTPVDYKNRTAVRQAAMLLLGDRDKSIEEISVETGFASSAYFRRVFKAVTGFSPREYRQKIKT